MWRGATRDDGAEQRRRGGADLRYFPKKEKTTEPNGKTLEPKIDMHDTGLPRGVCGFHLFLLIEEIEENYF